MDFRKSSCDPFALLMCFGRKGGEEAWMDGVREGGREGKGGEGRKEGRMGS